MSTDDEFMLEARRRLANFVKERDWSQFHNPKNLAMAMTGEVGELVEHFQWLTSEESETIDPDTYKQVRRELADVQIYVMLLADRLGINLVGAVEDKITENEKKYPVERARGRSNKYTDL